MKSSPSDRGRALFLRACELDVAVRKPGNVSLASPGHGMQAEMFIRSAQAAAGPLFLPGSRVGERIEAAQAASWHAAGCNTNLGILLLCAPIAVAVERGSSPISLAALRQALESVLGDLDVEDSIAAYRAIAAAHPGGLGSAPSQDVHAAPSVDLRAAMALAAQRDSIARQYRDGFAELFELALPALGAGFSPGEPGELGRAIEPATAHAVQRLYLTLLASIPDSHIVRKHGEPVAHIVMSAAQAWRARADEGMRLDADAGFAVWDAQLKAEGLNPGTTADLTVATLVLAGLADAATRAWHGS